MSICNFCLEDMSAADSCSEPAVPLDELFTQQCSNGDPGATEDLNRLAMHKHETGFTDD